MSVMYSYLFVCVGVDDKLGFLVPDVDLKRDIARRKSVNLRLDQAGVDLELGLANQLKLVIWDLDQTFWRGTLSEESVTLIPDNINILYKLCERGIVSSICSKNVYNDVKVVLEKHGLWQLFVFPKIAFEPKGQMIASLISNAGLRPENCLFIDDNKINLAEAAHVSPSLMTALPDEILPVLLDLPHARGKDDPDMTRLHQYKALEEKFIDRSRADGDNANFLRSCQIRLSITFDLNDDFDRIVELINRSNQLNYTKKRLDTHQQQDGFRRQLRDFSIYAGAVRASDRYSDYGVIGFFFIVNAWGERRLDHFVFSCRVMNMGIEQFVYEMLKRPNIEVVGPVSNPITSFDEVDWIQLVEPVGIGLGHSKDQKLLLLGACDLLQVANYCSSDRDEYVNHARDGVVVRYDDPGFILTPRALACRSTTLAEVPAWSGEDARRFDLALSEAKIIIVSMWGALFGQYVKTDDGVVVRAHEGAGGLGEYLINKPDQSFTAKCTFFELSPKRKMTLIIASLDRIAALSPGAHHRFVISRNTTGATRSADLRRFYNANMTNYCRKSGQFDFVDLDGLLSSDDVIDGDHFTRLGYHKIAMRIDKLIKSPSKLTLANRSEAECGETFRKVFKRAIRRTGSPVWRLPRLLQRVPAKLSGGRTSI